MTLPPELTSLPDDAAYDAAMAELGDLALAELGTPPGRRFDELVQLIEEYDAVRGGYLLLPREHRAASGHRLAARATAASPSAAPDFRAPVFRWGGARAPRA